MEPTLQPRRRGLHLLQAGPWGPQGPCACQSLALGPSAPLCAPVSPHGDLGCSRGCPTLRRAVRPCARVYSLPASCSSPSQRRLPRRCPADWLSWGAGLAQVHLETSLVSLLRETLRPRGRTSQAQSQPCEAQSMLATVRPKPPLTLQFLWGWLSLRVVRALPSQGLAPCPLTRGLSPDGETQA